MLDEPKKALETFKHAKLLNPTDNEIDKAIESIKNILYPNTEGIAHKKIPMPFCKKSQLPYN